MKITLEKMRESRATQPKYINFTVSRTLKK
jgi:hypothetical protein